MKHIYSFFSHNYFAHFKKVRGVIDKVNKLKCSDLVHFYTKFFDIN